LGTGSRYNSFIAEQAILLGEHIRTGFEDETYVRKGKKANSNAELVANLRDRCEKLGRPIATPEQARKILGMQQQPQQQLACLL
jgi:3-keto-5-aminohexanoate cleavage enzyme